MDVARTYDVLVLGGGNAALCAAIEAAQAGRTVLVLEAAPKHFRGGNSRHTRNLRCMHDAPADVLSDTYPEDEYWQDLLKVTGGQTNEALARMTIRHTATCREWMIGHGIRIAQHVGRSVVHAAQVARVAAVAAAEMLRRGFEHEHGSSRLRGLDRGTQGGIASAQHENVVRSRNVHRGDPVSPPVPAAPSRPSPSTP